MLGSSLVPENRSKASAPIDYMALHPLRYHLLSNQALYKLTQVLSLDNAIIPWWWEELHIQTWSGVNGISEYIMHDIILEMWSNTMIM
jgi:hypothetical protein